MGSPDSLRVYRLYCRGTCEERLLQLSDRMRGLDALCQQSHGRSVGTCAQAVALCGSKLTRAAPCVAWEAFLI